MLLGLRRSKIISYSIVIACFLQFSLGFAQKSNVNLFQSLSAPDCKNVIDTSRINTFNTDAQLVYKSYPDSAIRQYKSIEHYLEQLIEKCENLSTADRKAYLISLAMIKDEIGYYYSNKGEINLAMSYYLESLQIYEKISYPKGIANQLNNIGYIHQTHLNDLHKALDYFQKAYLIFSSLQDYSNAANTLHNIGSIAAEKGLLDTARIAFKKTLQLRKMSNNIGASTSTLNYLASIESKLNHENEAKNYLRKSIEICKEFNDFRALSNAYALLGNLYLKQYNLDSAFYYGKQALEIGEKLRFPFFIKTASKLLRSVYYEREDYQNAYLMQEKVRQIEDSTRGDQVKNQLLKQQILYEYEKKRFQDSLLFETKRIENELFINLQQKKIERNQMVRNGFVILLLLAGLTGIIYINRKKLDRERRQQTLKLQALQMEQKLLRLQMNPHFIFNALNSILSFVIENDTKEANQYLSRFSLLMQSILKQTEQEYISLEQELITLNLYAELEQLRFDNKFEFEIACQAEIDQQNTMIPPLIIQPFVENAIVHGIRHKNGPGKVFVNIAIDEDVLKIVVEDDGVGRLKAQQIKKKSGKTFRSLALELVKRRLERISTPTVKANYEIEDANPDNPENSGTKVKMYLPIFSAPNKTTNANNKLLDSISI